MQLRLDKFKFTFQEHSFNAEASCGLGMENEVAKDRPETKIEIKIKS